MTETEWLQMLASSQEVLGELLGAGPQVREAAGYGHTLAEICQQPDTWGETARGVVESRAQLADLLEGCKWLMLTGSGSSQYAAECVHPVLQKETGHSGKHHGGRLAAD